MSFADWMLLALACLAGASSPGPSLALLIRCVMRDGRLAGVVFGLAHGLGILLYAGLVSLGLGAVLALAPMVMIGLETAGVLFLNFIAWGMIRAGMASPAAVSVAPEGRTASLNRIASEGFLIVFFNPKVAAFFLAVFSQFLTIEQGATTRALMVLTAFAIDAGWYALVALVIALPAVLHRLERNRHRLELGIGIGLLLVAFSLAFRLISGA